MNQEQIDPKIQKAQRTLFSLVLTRLQDKSNSKTNGCLTAICDNRAYTDLAYLVSRKKKQENECSQKHALFSKRVANRTLDQDFLSSCYYADGLLLGYKLIEAVLKKKGPSFSS